jgi:hypothetical protein
MAACIESGLFLFLIESRPNEFYEVPEGEAILEEQNILYGYFPVASCCTGMTIMICNIVIMLLA